MIKIFTSFRKDLYLLFIISLLFILSIELVLIEIPEFFNGGALFGKIFLKICYSILASITFYFFGIYLGEYRKRQQILPLLNSFLDKIKFTKNSLLSEMYFVAITQNNGEVDYPKDSKSGFVSNYYPTESEIKILANNIPTNKTRHKDSDWIKRFYSLSKEILPICDSILILDTNLKASEISLISELKTCDLFSKIRMYNYDFKGVIANDRITFLEPELIQFFNLFERIEKSMVNN
ncbi:hypothetical protein [Pseudofulvibacter geojedonensis]|uniref:Uncharacterized protein n=1 Tax=Pseudofulvibacter geojedonensis TaxID=1123758 RepID=A0ABW3I5P3_9FLAO